jgi:signal transduction histidine kinase
VKALHARIAAAQLAERRRIGRDLHDGAQQRLLALTLRLFVACADGDANRLRREVAHSITELQTAISELRDLANGIHPPLLANRGLAAALDNLARRCPTPVHVNATRERFDQLIEVTAWFVVCEAVANALKHAHATKVEIEATVHDHHLILVIADDGDGGANADEHGLRGITDRAEMLGGRLRIDSPLGRGTTIRADLPLNPPR